MKIHIKDRNSDGRGRGSIGQKTALVSQAHPGEEVTMVVDRTTRGTLQGRVKELVRADPRRISHDCRHEFVCTGCALLAAPQEEEIRFKEARLREVLTSIEGEVPAQEPLMSPGDTFHYRHYGKGILYERAGRPGWGSYVAGTHKVVDNSRCPILVPSVARILGGLIVEIERRQIPVYAKNGKAGARYALVRHSRARRAQHLVLVTSRHAAQEEEELLRFLVGRVGSLSGASLLVNTSPGNVLLTGDPVPVAGDPDLHEDLLGFTHRIGPASFFQINPAAAEAMLDLARSMAGEGALCVETHSGVGALTLPLAERFKKVVAIEASAPSCRALEATAAEHSDRIGQIKVVTARAEHALSGVLEAQNPDAVILDPPRSGLGPGVTQILAGSSVQRVVLLSCAPETLATDLPPLMAGGFQVRRVVPVDQFPRTAHLETVTLLERTGG